MDLTKFIECHNFTFDQVFDEVATNEVIYQEAIKPLVDAAFQTAKVTCFAYGQTGSGKTYTMLGEATVPGLYLLAALDIFQVIALETPQLSVFVSFYEIYCGKLHDLLNDRQQLFAREDAQQQVNIVGLQELQVTAVQELMQLLEFGLTRRVTGVTGANDDSSRSHAVLQISLKRSDGEVHGEA